MKIRQWIAVVAVSSACVVSLAALRSTSVRVATPLDPGVSINAGKGKGPRCGSTPGNGGPSEVFCNLNGAQCGMLECDGNSCNCVCVPIPGCVPTQ